MGSSPTRAAFTHNSIKDGCKQQEEGVKSMDEMLTHQSIMIFGSFQVVTYQWNCSLWSSNGLIHVCVIHIDGGRNVIKYLIHGNLALRSGVW